MTAPRKEDKRATGKDWAKAITCSILLILLLLLLLGPKTGGGFGSGLGSGFGFAGNGPGGSGSGEGIGSGSDSGAGMAGPEKGAEDAGEAGGGTSTRETSGGDQKAASTTTFGGNSEIVEGKLPAHSPDDTEAEKTVADSAKGEAEEANEISSDFKGDRRFGGNNSNTFAIIQPNAAPAAPTETGNRFIGGKGRSGSSGGQQTGRSIGGMTVKGNTLGVILDTSGSMTPYLEDLRNEIARNFSSAIFLEVTGCSLYRSTFDPEKFLDSEAPRNNRRSTVMDALMELVLVHQVDSVYWFSDLQDGRQDVALQQLRNLVWGKEAPPLPTTTTRRNSTFGGLNSLKRLQQNKSPDDSRFRLYVRSTDEEPDDALDIVIRESGGQFQKKK